jgi:hypothetical protein
MTRRQSGRDRKPLVSTAAIDATEFPDPRRYNVNGVPKTIVNDEMELWAQRPKTIS